MNRKITLFSAPGPWSGVEVHTINLVKELVKLGANVNIIEVGEYQHYRNLTVSSKIAYINVLNDNAPIEYVHFSYKHISYWRNIFQPFKSDIIIIVKGHFDFGNMNLYIAARTCCGTLVAIEHMHKPLGGKEKAFTLGRFFKDWWRRKAQLKGYFKSIYFKKTICVSEACRKTLIQDYFYPDEKVFVFHSGVDINIFRPSNTIRSRVLDDLNISQESIVFGSVSRLSPMKNHHMMIEAFRRMTCRNQDKEIHLIIAGDGPLLNDLKQQVLECNMESSVHLVGFTNTPWQYYPAFDFFCLSSYIGEAFPLALLEAMSCDNRPIATDVGGVRESFTKDIGWLVEPNDCDAYAYAMECALKISTEGLTHLNSPREFVRKYFNIQERMQNLAMFLMG